MPFQVAEHDQLSLDSRCHDSVFFGLAQDGSDGPVRKGTAAFADAHSPAVRAQHGPSHVHAARVSGPAYVRAVGR